MTERTEVGRLAFRHEGEWWNAYWTPDAHSMARAILLGSIRMSVAMVSEPAKDAFMEAMKTCFEGICHDLLNQKPSWRDPRPAPEDERSGHA